MVFHVELFLSLRVSKEVETTENKFYEKFGCISSFLLLLFEKCDFISCPLLSQSH